MKKIVCFLFTISAILASPFISSAKDISSAEAVEILKTDKAVIVLDMRTPEEFATGHLVNAINININDSEFKGTIDKLDRDGTYLVYCRSGVRSRSANKVMNEMEFKNVYNLLGGFKEWTSKGLPAIK